MCGHAVLALTRLVAETGLVDAGREEIVFNVPCGRIVARPHWEGQGRLGQLPQRTSSTRPGRCPVEVPGIGTGRVRHRLWRRLLCPDRGGTARPVDRAGRP